MQADLKTFAVLGVHGLSAITCITAQNPRKVFAIEPCQGSTVRVQLEAVTDGFRPAAAKTGMLYSAEIITAAAAFFRRKSIPLVVDPLMAATSGARLLEPGAIRALCSKLLPLATLITPNVPEAEALTGLNLRSPEDLRQAAREIRRRFGCAVLVKGGHLRGLRQAVDLFFDGRNELMMSAPFVRGIRTHGTGCAYSAAITAYLTRGLPLGQAVTRAKEFVTNAIAGSRTAGNYSVLNFVRAKTDVLR
jgi:hydroxymethylpyrimidine kinase/phosphomethylpyrimidine kinase